MKQKLFDGDASTTLKSVFGPFTCNTIGRKLARLIPRFTFGMSIHPRNVSIAAQAPDLIGRESFSSRRFAILTIEDTGDHIVGIENGETTRSEIVSSSVRTPRG